MATHPAMHIAVSGAGGFLGSALVPALGARGWRVRPLVRTAGEPGGDAIPWDPERGRLDASRLEGVDAVIHLAGENLSGGRWTAARKRRILESRVRGTRLIAETLARLDPRPRVLVSASAVGWYGERGEARASEEDGPGGDFLAEVCRAWEEAALPARAAGIRVVTVRCGVVLAAHGGALAKMLTPFRLGAGGQLGDGRQYMSWISLRDAVRAILHVIDTDSLAGPVNVVAPEPVTNREFTRALARAIRRPAVMPIPAWTLRLIFGEMAAMLLVSTPVVPARLLASGFQFEDVDLEKTLVTLVPG